MRAAKALMFFTKGYEDSIETAVKNAVFHEQTDEIVIVKDIEMFRYHIIYCPFLFLINGYLNYLITLLTPPNLPTPPTQIW